MINNNNNIGTYTGRFAPSPTGALHFGSLVTAVASYFQAKRHNGQWLVRIEDIDKNRVQKNAGSSILKTLEAHHLHWDGEIVYQSNRIDYYLHAIEKLHKLKRLYRCQCSRKTIQQHLKNQCISNNIETNVYPGTCRLKNHPAFQPHSLRLLVKNHEIQFNDTIQGLQKININCLGDFVIQQRDGTISYQLAVAIDDAFQNITEVVRGFDLIDSSPRQILILRLLSSPIPQYCHIPIVCHKDGTKLSKQTGALALDNDKASQQLWQALSYLNQQPPKTLKTANIQQLHTWALQNWNISNISNKHNSLLYL